MPRWTEEENKICIQEMPKFRDYMINIRKGEKVRHGEIFAHKLLEKYPDVWIQRNENSLYQHLIYLDKLTAGKINKNIKCDEKFYGILLEEDENVEHIIWEDKEGNKHNQMENGGIAVNTSGTYYLSNEEIDKLLAFIGYGDLQKSKIIFFGNEEGLGGYELHNAIQAKCEVYGNNCESHLNKDNWKDGFYEIPEKIDGPYKKVMQKLRGDLREDKSLFSPMLEFQARIALHLQYPNQEWFLTSSESKEGKDNYQIIKNYYQTSLYNQSSSLNISLMDLRPFPRRNEKDEWPYANINRSEYLKAFKFENDENISAVCKELRNKRVAVLKRTIEFSSANLIIGIGDKESKRRFFEQNFRNNQKPIVFEELPLTKEKIELFKTSIQLENRTISVLLCDFFDYRNIGVEGLETLVKNHLIL
ncbi:hypothetical protein [Lysinibacillus sp. BW-2-10]|uniref:hypothetical protein n=1 Tax=Lysinibacillus sp. BW-2-10 TaxID=2590030 RepID=UPI00117FD20E|nr:hypothetical protein [Lysinibacillus sp. BW-2-10]TSI05295.1 hypothetical protein FJQ64_13405 [Lysinibacillus sp. BW-2-10]